MNTTAKKANLRIIKTHCPKCWKVTPHTRIIRDGMEVLRCRKCNTEQHYTYAGTLPEEE